MKFQRVTSAVKFYELVYPYLMMDEALHNLPLGFLKRCAEKEKHQQFINQLNYFSLVTKQDSEIVLISLMTPSHSIGIYGDVSSENIESAVQITIENILEEEIVVPGVIGQNDLAYLFAKEWMKKTGQSFEVAMNQCIYKLSKVNELIMSSGTMRFATMGDLDLISSWIHRFSYATEAPFTMEQAKQKAEDFIKEDSVVLWIDDHPVSMARKARSTNNGICVNLVYTPPDHTRKGYATSCVAELSKHLLKEGYKFCTLYTDLSNVSSNSIYKKIGYRPIGNSIVYHFN
ncbi:GNAT family N-acetyltransferase [Pseudalkalibacillus berkeleyi]|uniref:GNAT family N-acetyltransferase n=1 Tax=Pseudalkalibacillus berkeleyi TaxID=1069813 RepID=A0ABS9H134_9BACL|nr:GNAT family N-acetyltransferase [Pseudalkalibacillus berkeleyi]MCF6137365.1 GNAT family N-acetyltransferase [Pseudalkalibacillus berkeleyi]